MNTESKTITDNEVIARFMGYDIVEVDYFRSPEETEWQRKHSEWMDKVKIKSVGRYAVKVEEDIWQEWEDFDYSNDWSQLMPVVEKLNNLLDNGALNGLDMDIFSSMQDWITSVNITNAHGDAVTIINWYNSTQNKEKV